jgi:hypothetical protein
MLLNCVIGLPVEGISAYSGDEAEIADEGFEALRSRYVQRIEECHMFLLGISARG